VKDALENLMNVLSQNILIAPQHFAPLVKEAVSQTLLVIFDPYDFYSMLITGNENQLSAATLREEIKYLRINKAPLEKMLEKMEQRNLQVVSGNEALGILDEVLEEVNFTPEDVEEYIEKFTIVSALDPNRFFVSSLSEAPAKPAAPVNNGSSIPAPPPPQQEKPASPAKNNVQEVSAKERSTLADNFQKKRKIKESLTINQKFMFTKVLFHGDFELFTRAVDRLDQFDNLPSAIRYIEEEHASTWDRESEEFHEFMELVENRFA
jgi:hypothetical protein